MLDCIKEMLFCQHISTLDEIHAAAKRSILELCLALVKQYISYSISADYYNVFIFLINL